MGAQAEKNVKGKQAMGEATKKPLRVLLAEDEYLIRRALKLAIEGMGHEVVAAARDGEEAVTEAIRLSPDLIFMDLGLPKLTGVEAIAEIMAKAPTRIIVFSAYDDERLARAREAGAVASLVKPAWGEELKAALAEALAACQGGPAQGGGQAEPETESQK